MTLVISKEVDSLNPLAVEKLNKYTDMNAVLNKLKYKMSERILEKNIIDYFKLKYDFFKELTFYVEEDQIDCFDQTYKVSVRKTGNVLEYFIPDEKLVINLTNNNCFSNDDILLLKEISILDFNYCYNWVQHLSRFLCCQENLFDSLYDVALELNNKSTFSMSMHLTNIKASLKEIDQLYRLTQSYHSLDCCSVNKIANVNNNSLAKKLVNN
jgi:hypothetical protein